MTEAHDVHSEGDRWNSMGNAHHDDASFHGYLYKMSSELVHTEKYDESALIAFMRDGCNAIL